MKVAKRADRFNEAGAKIAVVAFDTLERIEALRTRLDLDFTFLHDPEQQSYDDYGLGRASPARQYSPQVIWGYAKMIAGGMRWHPHRDQDRKRLGGDFVVSPAGVLTLAHPERGPEDRVPTGTLLRAVQES